MNIKSNPLVSLINKPGFSSFAQNTMLAVSVETALKGIARPAFTMMDKKSDPEARKYSAAKEFIYQATCLALFWATLIPYKRIAFNTGKKFFKNDVGFTKFNKFKEFKKIEHKKEEVKKYPLVKGWLEANSIFGSIVCFTIIAPKFSHWGVPHILKAVGLEKMPAGKKAKNIRAQSLNNDNYNFLNLYNKLEHKA